MYLIRKIILFFLLFNTVVLALGTIQNESQTAIDNKRELFQPLTIFYQSGKYFPGTNDCMLIEKYLSEIKDKPSVSIIISAYTDPVGPAGYNLHLSELRAEEVKKILLRNGIPDSRIIVKALGESLSDTILPTDYHKMRKVEIRPIIMMK